MPFVLSNTGQFLESYQKQLFNTVLCSLWEIDLTYGFNGNTGITHVYTDKDIYRITRNNWQNQRLTAHVRMSKFMSQKQICDRQKQTKMLKDRRLKMEKRTWLDQLQLRAIMRKKNAFRCSINSSYFHCTVTGKFNAQVRNFWSRNKGTLDKKSFGTFACKTKLPGM